MVNPSRRSLRFGITSPIALACRDGGESISMAAAVLHILVPTANGRLVTCIWLPNHKCTAVMLPCSMPNASSSTLASGVRHWVVPCPATLHHPVAFVKGVAIRAMENGLFHVLRGSRDPKAPPPLPIVELAGALQNHVKAGSIKFCQLSVKIQFPIDHLDITRIPAMYATIAHQMCCDFNRLGCV